MVRFFVQGEFKDEFVTAGGVPLAEVRKTCQEQGG
jgi:hypothetical protein